jgi:hypothetical protein
MCYATLVVLTVVVVKSCIFWDITPRSPLKIDRHFGKIADSVFRVEEKDNEETIMKQVANLLSYKDSDMYLFIVIPKTIMSQVILMSPM